VNLRLHTVCILLLCLAAAALRLPGLSWGQRDGSWNQPDEQQHVGLAHNYLHRLIPDRVGDDKRTRRWNTRGYGHQVALVALAWNRTDNWSRERIRTYGRALSLTYGVLTVALVYGFVAWRFGRPWPALLAASLLATADLHVTYSHYAVPEATHTFWYLAAAAQLMLYARGCRRGWLLLGLGCAIGQCVSLKLDPTPALAFTALVPFMRNRSWGSRLGELSAVAAIALLTLAVSWATVDPRVLTRCLQDVAAMNLDAIDAGPPLLYNPLLYLAAAIGGSCLLVVCAAAGGLARLFVQPHLRRPCTLVPLVAMPGACLLLYWSGDVTLVRRALLFFPFMVICAALGIAWLPNRRIRVAAAVVTLVYGGALTAFSQYAFLNETRDRAADFLIDHVPPGTRPTVLYTRYFTPPRGVRHDISTMHRGRRRTLQDYHDVDYIVMHETYYGRYAKSFTTPFRTPERVEQVYHGDEKVFPVMRAILSGESDFVLLKEIKVRHPFPERLVFKALFGTYESFVGDVRIYVPAS
jgi:hypothetical protein